MTADASENLVGSPSIRQRATIEGLGLPSSHRHYRSVGFVDVVVAVVVVVVLPSFCSWFHSVHVVLVESTRIYTSCLCAARRALSLVADGCQTTTPAPTGIAIYPVCH